MTYSASRAKTGTTGTTFTVALMGVAVRAFAQLGTALKNRRQIAQLHHLDDRALKDIGLVRSDVHEALSVSLLQDPSRHLIDVAGEYRTGGYRTGDYTKVMASAPSAPAITAARQGLDRLRHADASVTPILAPALPKGCVNA